MGETDKYVENWRTEVLMKYYKNITLSKHKGGHGIPLKKDDLILL